ncbi:alpha/beta hydrolase fold domain-containing protein [Actinomycetaceae bacterium WB03_NA08]|uniref:Alpha/beta hydrolase fold domain-containing protein n=1 Tax=Scrofimicrobium canadense TaxID=2652290 RepID=A0A6N7VP29_9ACTO|nr:alpha/beta hydrolase fold domain-containing protein [Scrofimicrobium canadense]MSS83479.1 alpha/beta hydrolase fold domain-containing protein [Scrofimicrobium canadense]
MGNEEEYFRDNEANWDERTRIHVVSRDYDVEGFVSDPTRLSSVVQSDRPRLGSLAGQDVVHLQCHIGLDTLSLARLGARTVTGVDISGESIKAAEDIATRSGIDATFVKANVYDSLEVLDVDRTQGAFDVVYTGVGALWWLSDIDRWAAVVAGLLRPGGTLVLREDHPLSMSLGDDLNNGLLIEYPYFEQADPFTDSEDATYTDVAEGAPAILNRVNHGWNHSLGEIMGALMRQGLVITEFAELETVAWQRFPRGMERDGDAYRLNPDFPPIPLTYTLTARRQEIDQTGARGLLRGKKRNALRLADVDSEYRSAALIAPHVDITNPLVRRVSRSAPRLLPTPKIPGVTISQIHEEPLLRLYVPQKPSGAALLWIHGGGMVMGAPQQDDLLCGSLADTIGLTVVSVDYRLAPEHPFPIPQDDVLEAWTWLGDHAGDFGVDRGRLAVAGASAGGGLAASLVNRLRGLPGPHPVAQWLLYPMLDDRTAANEHLDEVDHFVWNNVDNRHGWGALLGGNELIGSADVSALAAPAREIDLSGVPPTWIGVGNIDLFYQEDLDYAARLRQSGVPVTFSVMEGAPHTFNTLGSDGPKTKKFMEEACRWLDENTQ